MKKIVSILLAGVVALTFAAALSGCAGTEYPVEIANIQIDKEPENIVVLDANTADIIAYMGYDGKIVGRSDQVDQQDLGAAPSVGASSNPSVQKIKDSKATVVFASDAIKESAVKSLEEDNIKVVKVAFAETPKQLQTNYKTIGKILGGKVTGEQKGKESYERLIKEMDEIRSTIPVDPNTNAQPDTICYLYYEGNNLKIMTRDTYGEMLLEYTNCVNIAGQINDDTVDVQVLKNANPKYVFYSDENALKAIKADAVMSKLSAVRGGNMLQITEREMKRQGGTAVQTVKRMVDFVYKGKISTPDEPVTVPNQAATKPAAQSATKPAANQPAQQATKAANQAAQQATKAANQAATKPAANAANQAATKPAANTAANTSVAAQYKINLTKLSLKLEEENGNVKIMQKRLYDLGYIDDPENVTGYYGEVSEKAVQNFQKANGIKVTGTADNATLVKLFDKTAKKAG